MSRNRADAVRIRELDGFHSIVPYVMPKRTEAEVSSVESFDVTELCAYLRRRNDAEGANLKLFHAICTAVARTIWLRPKMNIFIAGRRFWQRRDITLSFVAKQRFDDAAEEVLLFLKIEPDMTIDDISRIILGDVKTARTNRGNDLDKTMRFVGKLPRPILEILFAVLRRLEYHGIMPASLTKGDPNYSTALLANLGSIGAGCPYHHLSNYGTCSIMATIGTCHKELRRMPDGSEAERDILNANITFDERIADGFYFAKSVRILRFLLEHPENLEQPVSAPVPVDID